MQAGQYTCMCACTVACTCLYACVHACRCVRACVRACGRAGGRVYICVCVCVLCMFVYWHACKNVRGAQSGMCTDTTTCFYLVLGRRMERASPCDETRKSVATSAILGKKKPSVADRSTNGH